MAPRKNQGADRVAEDFIKELEETASEVKQILKELRNSDVDFVKLKTELKFLVENFRDLSKIIRDGNGHPSLLTRVALLEQALIPLSESNKRQLELDSKIAYLLSWIETIQKNQKTSESIKIAEKNRRWGLMTAVITSIIALITAVGTTIIGLI